MSSPMSPSLSTPKTSQWVWEDLTELETGEETGGTNTHTD